MYWLCGEQYRNSGRLSRTWIMEGENSPDTPEDCPGRPECICDRGEHVPYPFNGMGGVVFEGYLSIADAQNAEDALWEAE